MAEVDQVLGQVEKSKRKKVQENYRGLIEKMSAEQLLESQGVRPCLPYSDIRF